MSVSQSQSSASFGEGARWRGVRTVPAILPADYSCVVQPAQCSGAGVEHHGPR